MWRGRNTPAITPETLLGSEFVKGLIKRRFATREEWEAYKKDVTDHARWHGRILKRIRAGTIKTRKIMDLRELERDAKNEHADR